MNLKIILSVFLICVALVQCQQGPNGQGPPGQGLNGQGPPGQGPPGQKRDEMTGKGEPYDDEDDDKEKKKEDEKANKTPPKDMVNEALNANQNTDSVSEARTFGFMPYFPPPPEYCHQIQKSSQRCYYYASIFGWTKKCPESKCKFIPSVGYLPDSNIPMEIYSNGYSYPKYIRAKICTSLYKPCGSKPQPSGQFYGSYQMQGFYNAFCPKRMCKQKYYKMKQKMLVRYKPKCLPQKWEIKNVIIRYPSSCECEENTIAGCYRFQQCTANQGQPQAPAPPSIHVPPPPPKPQVPQPPPPPPQPQIPSYPSHPSYPYEYPQGPYDPWNYHQYRFPTYNHQ